MLMVFFFIFRGIPTRLSMPWNKTIYMRDKLEWRSTFSQANGSMQAVSRCVQTKEEMHQAEFLYVKGCALNLKKVH